MGVAAGEHWAALPPQGRPIRVPQLLVLIWFSNFVVVLVQRPMPKALQNVSLSRFLERERDRSISLLFPLLMPSLVIS